ncbi:MAG TPA: mechanosensitive ion channel domain-containing protein [Sulfuricurvum sp.]|nr:mechanosensitive ion channel domain-containing protein [Sulfuricurvum sp.]
MRTPFSFKPFIALFFLVTLSLHAATKEETKDSVSTENETNIELKVAELEKLQKDLAKENSVWIKSYDSYTAYRDVRKSLREVKWRINELQERRSSAERKLELEALQAKERILTDQVNLLQAQGGSPFVALLKPDEAGEPPAITNPLGIIVGLSYIKRQNSQFQDYTLRSEDLQDIISNLEQQVDVYKELTHLDPKEQKYWSGLNNALLRVEKFKLALDTLSVTTRVYEKRLESSEAKINKEIKDQFYKLFTLFVVVVILLLISFLIKRAVKHYVVDNERFYMVNKIITLISVSLITIVMIFSYIDNVGYFATVLGFASAGLAIAMRDWFMSLFGWVVIFVGGSIHVGDRVRFVKEGIEYVGDVLDISPLRITLMEDVTLTTIETNRRAGRIIFVPNNYIFTSMIANYSHASLKTVWDGIDIMITFDSNHKKAVHIVKEICRKYSKGYTEITRKQINKLRDRYSLKSTNVEPRVFTFIESNGIKVSGWYLTNAYATLTLRSTISGDIVDAFNAEPDITIAYPTQTFYTAPIPPKSLPNGDES